MSTRILLVEDEPGLVVTLSDLLSAEGYDVASAVDGPSGLARASAETFDLVILDVMLPGKTGFEVCRELRQHGKDMAILMLTAKAQLVDRVVGLKLGADDYLTKPFAVSELLARVRAVLRRSKFPNEVRSRPRFASGDLEIDFAQHRVTMRGRPVDLSATEYRLLSALARNANRVMLHEELLREVWGPEYRDEKEYLRVYVRYLRQKLEADPSNPQLILTQPGAGYILIAPPDRPPSAS